MTAPAIEATSIEQLDHEPQCQCSGHQGTPPRADYYIDQHGCDDYLFCAACLAEERARLAQLAILHCDVCGRTARALDDLITVRPLR